MSGNAYGAATSEAPLEHCAPIVNLDCVEPDILVIMLDSGHLGPLSYLLRHSWPFKGLNRDRFPTGTRLTRPGRFCWQRFLTQDVQASLQGAHGDRVMRVVSSGNDQGIDLSTVDQFALITKNTRDLPLVGHLLRFSGIAAADRRKLMSANVPVRQPALFVN